MEKSLLDLLKEEDRLAKELDFCLESAQEWKELFGYNFDNPYTKEYYDMHIDKANKISVELAECRNNIRKYIDTFIFG